MDNFSIRVVSEGREAFDKAIAIAFLGALGGQQIATHYSKTGVWGFVLYWHEEPGNKETIPASNPLPLPLNATAASDLIWHWLQTEAEYPEQPSHDGSNEKGWLVYNEQWGHCANSFYGFVGVKPEWAWYGK